MNPRVLAASLLVLCGAVRADKPPPSKSAPPAPASAYVPPPAAQVTNYFATVLPCKIDTETEGMLRVTCTNGFLESKTLRELAILRNTIYSRYGWDGYRKPWLRDYFHAQPWFKPNPAFSYRLISDIDKKNAHLIAAREQSLTSRELRRMKSDVMARRGKVWGDVPKWHLKSGKWRTSCDAPDSELLADDNGTEEDYEPEDCHYRKVAWYKPNPAYSDALLTAEDKIELGLLSRAMGNFSVDGAAVEKTGDDSLGRQLKLEEVRQLSLRDLRLLRNTIYARHGRKFKSQVLQQHFDGMSWYQQNPAYSDKLLTRNEERNVALIRSVENEFGGALTDDDWLTEPATDGS